MLFYSLITSLVQAGDVSDRERRKNETAAEGSEAANTEERQGR